MSGNLGDFNANDVEPQSFDVLPAGDYEVAIVGSVVQGTKAGTGKYLNLELQVLSGKYKGRKLFDLLNLWNPNPQAQEIAKGTLSAICRAVGVLTPGDSQELHNRPLVATVKVKRDEQYGDKNVIRGYRRRNGQMPGQVPNLAQKIDRHAGQVSDDEIPF
jgi:hypothetical protein